MKVHEVRDLLKNFDQDAELKIRVASPDYDVEDGDLLVITDNRSALIGVDGAIHLIGDLPGD
jgi:hypothetical protein